MRRTLFITLFFWSVFTDAAETPSDNSTSNRLINSQSPYLLQHAHNPVDWFPWGDEAFQKAESEGKLVFISIGYSTCHWCHVMNRESFSDEEIAAYLNEHYVCIKVDREERPDIDGVYMNFVQNLTGSGGWPLNVWLTPDKKPFYGGTYFPARSENGRPGFIEMITQIQGIWADDPADLLSRSDQIVATLNEASSATASGEVELSLDILSQAISAFHFMFDNVNAGFSKDNKFPSPANLSFLLRSSRIPELPTEDQELAKRIALETLDAIANGGIRDHIGGGFHRYTVDSGWQLPHFEKMLYDQALISEAFVDAWQLTSEERYKTAATDTLDYLLREMRHDSGAFYSAEDAESYAPEDTDTKREGAFYVWSTEDFERLIPDDKKRELAIAYFSVLEGGNAPYGRFPTEEMEGYNTLRIERGLATIAEEQGIEINDATLWIQEAKAALFQERETRIRPHLDDKIITGWNGLAISALARASQAFDRKDYAEAATRNAAFIRSTLYDSKTKRLARLFRNTVSNVDAFAEDYAFLIDGLIDLYEATADHKHLAFALELQNTQNELFYDSEQGGYYSFSASDEIVFDPSKVSFDGAIPSTSSVSAKNLARLSQFFDNKEFQNQARQTISAFIPQLEQSPTSMPALLDSLVYVAKKPLQIVIAGDPNAEDVQAMLRVVNSQLLPNRAILFADEAEGQTYLGQSLEFIQAVTAFDGHATAYVCENYVCQLPTESIEKLREQLAERF